VLGEPVDLAGGGVLVTDGAAHGVVEIHLAADQVFPGRRAGVLEVRHERLHRRVQGVDDHLAIDRAGDLHAPVGKVRGHRGDAPVACAHRGGVRQKLRQRPLIEQRLAPCARLEQLEAPRVEPPVQARQQLQRERRQHLLRALDLGSQHLELRPVWSREYSRAGLSAFMRRAYPDCAGI